MTRLKFLRLPEVINKIGIQKTAIYDRITRQEFPKGIQLAGGRAVVWLESDVEAWMQEQVESAAA